MMCVLADVLPIDWADKRHGPDTSDREMELMVDAVKKDVGAKFADGAEWARKLRLIHRPYKGDERGEMLTQEVSRLFLLGKAFAHV
jgi:hypothetical protein